MKLMAKNRNFVIAEHVEVATSFRQRLVGLLGRKSLEPKKALWIHGCRSIHTFFMQFPIDVVFVDRQLKVCKVVKNIKPWRYASAYFCGHSVFEFASPHAALNELKRGDLLYVGD
jgi:uncharacterized protein